MIKISVVIPVYNAEKYVRQCLDSVRNQTLEEIEIICVDDGSTDSSLSILKEYEASDSRVKIISQKNGGAGAARNKGMAMAAGKYLSFLDADDFFEPDMLSMAYEKAEEYQADFVAFRSDQYYMNEEYYAQTPWSVRMRDIPPYMPFTYRQFTDNVFEIFVGWAWDKLYRRSFVQEKQLYFQEQRTANDLLFVFSALVTAKRIAVVDKVLAHQRRGGTESLSVTREKSWGCFYDALTALRERLKQENVFWELEQDYINYALHFSLWNLNTLAKPTCVLLENRLCGEWFQTLGIEGKPEHYFYNKGEYRQYKELMARNKRLQMQKKG